MDRTQGKLLLNIVVMANSPSRWKENARTMAFYTRKMGAEVEFKYVGMRLTENQIKQLIKES